MNPRIHPVGAYMTSDGKLYAEIADAEQHELALTAETIWGDDDLSRHIDLNDLCTWLIEHEDDIPAFFAYGKSKR